MINTFSNLQGRISQVVKITYYTRAYGTHAIPLALITHDILPYKLDNIIILL